MMVSCPEFQQRKPPHRYAWTAKLPLAIVIDFDEFAVFDCRIRPRPAGKQIDQLAGELYGLTDDEIRIVEEATT